MKALKEIYNAGSSKRNFKGFNLEIIGRSKKW